MNIGSRLRGFNPSTFELHIAFAGTGSGSVTQSPPSVVIKGDCRDVYLAGSILSFIATPAENSVFAGWSEDVEGSEPSCYVIMDSPKKVVAKFSLITKQENRIGPFVDNGNGTVTDTRTGLMWMRFVEGQSWSNGYCYGMASRLTLEEAKAILRDFAGYIEWRLPTIDELESLVEESRKNPAFDPVVFPGFEKVHHLFWTSSSANSISGQPEPLCVSFYSGATFNGVPVSRNSVRLVRNATPRLGAANVLAANQVQPLHHRSAVIDSNARFYDFNDGTVQDMQTGLTWMRCPLGQTWEDRNCVGRPEMLQWQEAVSYKHSFAGCNDWRLPEIDELRVLVDRDFSKTKGFFWSATSESNAVDTAWIVDFETGRHRVARTLNRFLIRLVRGGYRLQIFTVGSGFGDIVKAPIKKFYTSRSKVTLTATPQLGSRFSSWTGDIVGSDANCFLIMDADKEVTANFEEKLLILNIVQSGTGSGAVHDSLDQSIKNDSIPKTYPEGLSVTLIAIPASDSVFMGWSGDVSSKESSISLLMDAERSVSANFQLKSFELTLSREGAGSGEFVCTPAGSCHDIGTQLTLTAKANPGSVFSGWTGDVVHNELTCSFVMDSAKTVTANFSRIAYALDVLKAGSGTGTVTRNLLSESYFYGDTVTLTATAAKGSIFSGWAGAATGIDATLSLVFDADKTLIASFKKLNISNFDITVDFVSAEHASMKTGDDAFILYLSIANQGQKQVRMALPLVSYVTHAGEEIQQDAWLTGLIIGNEGATLRAGAFRKAGLVFFKSKLAEISAGDQFHVSISQSTPALRFDFSFKCTDSKSRSFTLIDAAVEAIHVPLEIPASTFDASAILQRLELLETGLSDVLFRLAKLEAAPPELIKNTENIALTVTSLSQVLAWLVTQERVPIAGLRERLLPLDQFPGAFIDKINEKALDLNADLALEEVGDEILIAQQVLTEVLANWQDTE
ncbi:MAG: DUF1566 domain-containing protein [Rhodocyclaceae bacterium]|nr:DUF1566 domain-containing protein [Rhodocyclaceae bacterium]